MCLAKNSEGCWFRNDQLHAHRARVQLENGQMEILNNDPPPLPDNDLHAQMDSHVFLATLTDDGPDPAGPSRLWMSKTHVRTITPTLNPQPTSSPVDDILAIVSRLTESDHVAPPIIAGHSAYTALPSSSTPLVPASSSALPEPTLAPFRPIPTVVPAPSNSHRTTTLSGSSTLPHRREHKRLTLTHLQVLRNLDRQITHLEEQITSSGNPPAFMPQINELTNLVHRVNQRVDSVRVERRQLLMRLQLLQHACIDRSAVDPHLGPLLYNTGKNHTAS